MWSVYITKCDALVCLVPHSPQNTQPALAQLITYTYSPGDTNEVLNWEFANTLFLKTLSSPLPLRWVHYLHNYLFNDYFQSDYSDDCVTHLELNTIRSFNFERKQVDGVVMTLLVSELQGLQQLIFSIIFLKRLNNCLILHSYIKIFSTFV